MAFTDQLKRRRLGRGVGARSAALPLDVEGIAAAATAQNVGAPVASTHRGGTLRHFRLK